MIIRNIWDMNYHMPRYRTKNRAANRRMRTLRREALPELEADMSACIQRALGLGRRIVALRANAAERAAGYAPSGKKGA